MVAGFGGQASVIVGAGEDISLNLDRSHILSYVRQGQALQITLVDGRTVMIEGFFSPEGAVENQLFISSNGQLAEVDLIAGEGNLLFSQYIDADSFGKWSPDDELYFVRGADVQLAGVVTSDPDAGMFGTGFLAGLGGLGTAAAAAGAVAAGAVLVDAGGGGGGGGGGGPKAPVVDIVAGTSSTGTVLNETDHADGVTISGTGTAGASGTITVGGVSHDVTVDGSGNWTTTYTTTELPGGEYETDVSITITNAGGSATATDTVVIDTVVNVSFAAETTETDGTINHAEESDGFTLTVTTDAGSTVVVSFGGASYTATVTGTSWSLNVPAGVIAGGEYDLDVTVTASDAAGNTTSTSGIVHIDTITDVVVNTGAIGGDNTVNAVEHAAGVAVNGFAEANATVVVSLGGASHTVQAGANGAWTTTFSSGEVAEGTYDATVTAVSTDAAGNTSTATGTVHIDTELAVSVNTNIETDGIVNAVERADGITLTGQSDPNATISVTFGGTTVSTVANASGGWSANFAAGSVPEGELNAPVSVTASDAAGNTATTSGTVRIDTVMNVTVNTANVEGDGTVNLAERADGVTLTGTTQPNATVVVDLAGASRTVTADASGHWSASWNAASIPTGETDAAVNVTATDAAGNVATTSGSINIDTVVNVGVDTAGIETDGIVNFVERADGITLTGTSDPNASVLVNFAGTSRSVTADASGNWSADYNASAVPSGERTANVTVTATDVAGNTATASDTVNIDTFVNRLNSTGAVEGDEIVNAAEASDGIRLTGQVEVGSSVMVTFEGTTRAATVMANGNWYVNFDASEIPAGQYETVVQIEATDAAGNTASITDTFAVDTIVPDAPDIEDYTDSVSGVKGFTMLTPDGDLEITQVTLDGSAGNTVKTPSHITDFGDELGVRFATGDAVPDGSHLVVTASDDAGNSNSTLFVLNDTGTNAVDISATSLNGFNIGAIDLELAEDSQLTLSTADINALSGTDNTLIVHGGVDDTVTLNGTAVAAGTQTINGQDYNVYTLGEDGSRLIINEDIAFTTSVV